MGKRIREKDKVLLRHLILLERNDKIGIVIFVAIVAFIVGFVITADSNGAAEAGLEFGIIFGVIGAIGAYAILNTIGAI